VGKDIRNKFRGLVLNRKICDIYEKLIIAMIHYVFEMIKQEHTTEK
jgi:hypothetical protein